MSQDVECPYCSEWNEINHDDGRGYAEGEMHQQECWQCAKTFTFNTQIHFSYEAFKADCLNDGPHQYEKTHTIPKEYARLRCKCCGDEKPLDYKEPTP
ncbi:hypothetical protein FNL37_1814 [Methylovorus glucosotrophus]|nr:hypothetical protein FNL37_1814 [Methylovorus glucosotrophus]